MKINLFKNRKIWFCISILIISVIIFLLPYIKENLNSERLNNETKKEILNTLGVQKTADVIIDNLPIENEMELQALNGIGKIKSKKILDQFRLGGKYFKSSDIMLAILILMVLLMFTISLFWYFYFKHCCHGCLSKKLNEDIMTQYNAILGDLSNNLEMITKIVESHDSKHISQCKISIENDMMLTESLAELRMKLNSLTDILK